MGGDLQSDLPDNRICVKIMSWNLFVSLWSWDPSVILGCAGLIVGYLAIVRPRKSWKTVWFIAGVVTMFVALESPLDTLGDTYLFSAHMLQHLMLTFAVPPLLLIGIPKTLMQKILDWPLADRVERILGRPAVAWVIANVTLWVWHIPVMYNATLENEFIHAFEHLLFLITWTIFWWPMLSPIESRRIAPLATIPYTFAAGVSNSFLGILLTYAQPGIYPEYVNPVDEYGALHLIRNVWGISPLVDQQLGGLFMWVPGMLVFLFAAMAGLSRWYHTPDESYEVSQPNSLGDKTINPSPLKEV
jgi:cytochrome c oxidase assembly factor CtaG